MIPIKDYQQMRDRLENEADFRAIEASKRRQAKSPQTPLQQVRRELGLAEAPKRT